METELRRTIESSILEKMEELEKCNNITIVYSVEAGSRAYGYNTETSDYDIRFVYYYNDKREYLKLDKPKETLCGFSNENNMFDWCGWELRKTVQHLKESNPNIIEWLNSPIVYIDKNNFKSNCKSILLKMHSHMSLMYHYYSMAKNNWKVWIEDKNVVITKKYFHVIRPLANLILIMDKYLSENPSNELIIDFETLMENIKNMISNEIYNEVKNLLENKRKSTQKDISEPNIIINEWIISVFEQFEKLRKENKTTNNETDFAIQSIIRTHKKLSNEVKKINDITKVYGYTSRSNYLSAIELCLQIIWFDENTDKHTKDLPTQMNILLSNVNIVENVRNEINKIINELTIENRNTQKSTQNLTHNDMTNFFIKPAIEALYKNKTKKENNIPLKEMMKELKFSDQQIELIINPKRNDYVEVIFKNYYDLIWLLLNFEEHQNAKPKDILNVENIFPNDIVELTKNTITELRPKYIISHNDIVNEWMNNIVNNFEPKVKEIQKKIALIKEENTKKRLANSLRHVEKEYFENLIFETLKI